VMPLVNLRFVPIAEGQEFATKPMFAITTNIFDSQLLRIDNISFRCFDPNSLLILC